MLSPFASNKSTLPDDAVSDKSLYMSTLNPQLMSNAAGCVYPPSNVVVSESVPQDFIDINDSSEIHRQHVGKTDYSSMSWELVAFAVTSVECDSHTVGDLTSRTTHLQPNIIMRSPERNELCSPVFNHQGQFAVHVPVSSSPSLFDDDEEKRLHQRNISKNLLWTNEKNVGTVSHICADVDVSQSSHSVLSRKLDVNVSAHQENEKNKYQVKVVNQQQTLPSPMQSAISERGSLQTVNKAKSGDICDSKEILPNKMAMTLNGADVRQRHCYMQMLDVHSVPAKDISVASAIDTLAVSTAETTNKQNLLVAEVKLSQQDVTSDAYSLSDVEPIFHQPLPKKRRHEGVKSNSPHAGSSDSRTQDNSKFFMPELLK